MRKMVFTVIGAVAELKRSLIQERVLMGLGVCEGAREQDKRLGRARAVRGTFAGAESDGARSTPDRLASSQHVLEHGKAAFTRPSSRAIFSFSSAD